MRAATVSVGLVSPRSTCESIGALTPLLSARSRSESPDASRSAFTRAPMTAGASSSAPAGSGPRPAGAAGLADFPVSWAVGIRPYVITDGRMPLRYRSGRR